MNKILNYIDEGVIICDLEKNILFANDYMTSKLGFSYEEICKMNIFEIAYKDEDIFKEMVNENNKNKIRNIKFCSKENKLIMFNIKLGKDLWRGQEVVFLLFKEVICGVEYNKDDLEKILDLIPYGIWVKNLQGEYVYINKRQSEVIGKEKSEILMHNELQIWNEEDCEHFRGVDQEVIKSQKSILEQHKIKGAKNEDIWYETYKAPINDFKGEVKYVMGISKDINLAKKIEKELERSHKDMMTLNSMIPNSVYNGDNLLNSIKNELIERLKPDGGTIWLCKKDTLEIKPLVSFGISEEPIKKLSKISLDNINHMMALENAVEGITLIEERKYIKIGLKELDENKVKYSGIYKIRCGNEIIGFINILYKDINDFDIKSDDFMKTICNQLGMIIKNDMLSNDIKCELQKRREVEEELQMFLDTAVDLISIVDLNKKFKRVNSGWTSILGWTEEELLAMDNTTDIIFPDDIELTEEIVEELKTKLSIRGAINRYVAKNGEVRWIEWSSRYIPEKGVSICTGRDITKFKNSEEQREIYKKALEMERIKSEFFTNISHEFKTPLNIILTAMQLIMKNTNENNLMKDYKIIGYMNSVKQNSYRLLKLVNNFIDISKIDAGYYELILENENIVSVVEEITMSVADYMKHKGIKLIFDTNEEEIVMACDSDKIERIILNLLSNSIKYSKTKGNIRVDISTANEKVIISVTDDGIGIEEEKLQVIFDRFSQVKNKLTRDCEGSGIGLSLVKALVDMHQGTIKVESEINVGTKFSIELPIKLVEKVECIIEAKDIMSSKVEKCNVEFSDIYR